ncbi:hypothetical protein FIC87_12535 [Eggerthella lenta]|uniref:Zinc-ribbon domain-containing protein n=1 Tax=Eggerthella lenta TaxID=84112 RepID=A0A5C5BRF0_EGGLN|nr:hypothetical protein [Eggerthella lenta]TNU89020.1 hypothetical protein FIC87_12535 [Eggerthella lenta]
MSDYIFGTDAHMLDVDKNAWDGFRCHDFDDAAWVEIDGNVFVRERTCRPVRHEGRKSNGWWTCSECGARINGHPLSNPDKYCGRCGAKVVSE